MEQTIEQAATALGKSVRQVRYLIKTGKLRARKIGATWVVESADLPRSPEQLEVAAQKVQRLREVVDGALDPTHSSRRRYSVRDLRATQVLLPLLHSCTRELGGEHPATRSLQLVLEHLTRGCHRFRRAEKGDAYRELYLEDADERLLVLRVHLRLAAAAGYLREEQILHSLTLADRVGRQLGGWKAWQANAEAL